ncbi:hypothetical protein VTL71DRAFT_12909 [Oculimacula yallundae]|uniref:Uncharacterized protein n=1 Tax=Oculimacula yallundae TaxID=86028 RepID=A0ABR4CRH3_9HELO
MPKLFAVACSSLALTLIIYSFKVGWERWNKLILRSSRLNFHDIPPLPDFNVCEIAPQPCRPWKAGKYNMTMGIRSMPEEDWLVVDNLYEKEQECRTHLLKTNYAGVLQYLPPAEEACKEALDCIVRFLVQRYPSKFWLIEGKPGYVHNSITSKTFRFIEPYKQHPLSIAAQLAMEDINLLMPGVGEKSNEYFLQASFSFAPAGCSAMGFEVEKSYGKVSITFIQMCDMADLARFFLGLKVSNPVQRHNFFVQTDNTMFQQEPFADTVETPPKIEDIRIRHERQTLRRLPRTGAVMFLVRTYLSPITELEQELDNLYSLRSAINAWPAEMAKYKGRHVWHETFEN